MFVKFKKYNTA